jgi:hypothetical protein
VHKFMGIDEKVLLEGPYRKLSGSHGRTVLQTPFADGRLHQHCQKVIQQKLSNLLCLLPAPFFPYLTVVTIPWRR